MITTLDSKKIEALIQGNFDDVFSVLGMHSHPSEKGLVVRAFIPGATSVDVIANVTNKIVTSLTLVHADGLFAGKMGRRVKPFSYHLNVQFGEQSIRITDPYQFSSQLNSDDLYLFGEGTQEKLYQWMGAHAREVDGVAGMLFVVWAPEARRVSVVGEFNHWDGRRHVMRKHPASGIWEIFIPDLGENLTYKYEIKDQKSKLLPLKSDPYAFAMQHPPETASLTTGNEQYVWQDTDWMTQRDAQADPYHNPVSIYEVHLGSWRRESEQGNRYLTYRELAEQLIPYVLEMGFTHLQLMPVTEFPFDGSWGYQPIGMFAPTSRFGSPDEFKYFVDCCHQNGIALILDWVPGHFPTDEHGLGRFDGSCLYEHEDVRKGFHPDWNTLIYNYSRGEVVSYLLSNAMYWLDEFHIDGLRVDAVASMLYLDYSREDGEWIPNQFGGRENLEAVDFFKQLNSRLYFNYPGVMMVAEESTSWPGVSKAVNEGGLGFGFKWNMGWMNDTLRYMERDPIHRKFHHNELTFSLVYAFSENFVLPISHDEVVHGKKSLLNKMPGDEWQKFANLRTFLAFMWTHPGKKLLFMGCEFGQKKEWNHDIGLDWHLLDEPQHKGIQLLVKDLNSIYRSLPALHQLDCDGAGFEWLDANNSDQSVLAYLRKGNEGVAPVIVIVNLTPNVHENYKVGVTKPGFYHESLNTDSNQYAGSNTVNIGDLNTIQKPYNAKPCHITMTIPPLATLIFEWQEQPKSIK